MNCEELRQNAPAYVLGALTENEVAEFESHITECDIDHEIEDLTEVTLRLSAAAPPMEPPAGLRDRILQAAGEFPTASADTHQAARPGLVSRLSSLGGQAYAAAAVLLVALGVLIGWGIASISTPDGEIPVQVNHFRRDPEGDWFRVETTLGESGLTLSVGNMNSLPGQSRYQFWAIRDDQWVPVGAFNTNADSRWSGDFDFALEQGDSIAITVEPDGERESPSSEAEIRSRI